MKNYNDVDDGWGEWTSASEWDTGKHDVQFECIDGIHRVRMRPRKPTPPREFWIVIYDGSAWDSEAQAQEWAEPLQSMIVHVREVLE